MKVYRRVDRENLPWDNGVPQVGVEWEIEGVKVDLSEKLSNRIFSVIEDGTLRNNGNEIILRKPLVGDALNNAIDSFYNGVDFSELNNSELCSTHIHVNVLPLNYNQVVGALLLAASYDLELFANHGSKNRINNVYCTPSVHSPIFFRNIKSMWSGTLINLREQKYKSINLTTATAMNPIGSVEFRHFNVFNNKRDLMAAIKEVQCIIQNGGSVPENATANDYISMLNKHAAPGKTTNNIKQIVRSYVCAGS